MSNSNIMNISKDSSWGIYEDVFLAAGWRCNILTKEKSTKEEFIKCIISNISKGKPLIAVGIVGAPEACIITGYLDEGNCLLGWNYFQDNPEFAAHLEIDESGYFISSDWWENPATTAIIELVEKIEKPQLSNIIERIYSLLTSEEIGAIELDKKHIVVGQEIFKTKKSLKKTILHQSY